MEIRLAQSLNAVCPISFTDFGMDISTKLEQPKKAYFPMLKQLFCNETDFNTLQSWKVSSAMFCTFCGIVMAVSPAPRKAAQPICVTPSGILISVRFLQSRYL